MPKYKELRGNVKQSVIVAAVRKADRRVDLALYSKYENGVALPTPPQARAICDALKCDVLDLYDRDEIALASIGRNNAPQGEKRRGQGKYYNIHLCFKKDVCKWLKPALAAFGYSSIQEWGAECLEELRKKYEKFEKKEF